ISKHQDAEPSPTQAQIWRFLVQIGVKGNVVEDEIIRDIQSMEQRDLENFLEMMQAQNKAYDEKERQGE
ncbi:hypothetical protein Ancab_022809, partial [Ancistrocladus abbreviatus]